MRWLFLLLVPLFGAAYSQEPEDAFIEQPSLSPEFDLLDQENKKFRRSPEPEPLIYRDPLLPHLPDFPPKPSPTFPKPPTQDPWGRRYVRSPEPFVDRSSMGGRRGGSGFQLPPGVNPTFPKNGGLPDAYKNMRFRRSPEPEPLIHRDPFGPHQPDFPPKPSPTFPRPPTQDPWAHRYARSPEPFVDRSSMGGRRGGSGFQLPPGVNPTFPKNGGLPDAYKNMRFRRSPEPEPLIYRDTIGPDKPDFLPKTGPTFPRPPTQDPWSKRFRRSPEPEPQIYRDPFGPRQSDFPPKPTPTFPRPPTQDPWRMRFRRSPEPEPQIYRDPLGPHLPDFPPKPSPTFPRPPTQDSWGQRYARSPEPFVNPSTHGGRQVDLYFPPKSIKCRQNPWNLRYRRSDEEAFDE